MDRKRLIGALTLFCGAVTLSCALVLKSRERAALKDDMQTGSVMVDVPGAQVKDIPDSKTESIVTRVLGRKENISDYYDSCMARNSAKVNEDPLSAVGGGEVTKSSEPEPKTSGELFPDASARESAAPSEQPSRRMSPQQREERHRKRREEAVRMAGEMSRQNGADAPREAAEPPEERISIGGQSSSGKRISGVISSLCDSGGEISSLQNEGEVFSSDSEHPFRCLFLRNEKVKSGQKVSIRLLEDMAVGDFIIPKNTHLQAYATVDTRLELEINSIEIGGRIVQLCYAAYDTDGIKGIYCPDAGDATRTVKTSGLSTIGSVLGGRVGRVAGEMVNTGVSIAQSAAGERTVNVPAGYNFFIVKKKQN